MAKKIKQRRKTATNGFLTKLKKNRVERNAHKEEVRLAGQQIEEYRIRRRMERDIDEKIPASEKLAYIEALYAGLGG